MSIILKFEQNENLQVLTHCCCRGVCHEVWETEEHRTLYSTFLLVLQYVIPLLVLVFTYSSIAVVVWGKRPPGEAENCRDQRMARSKRKVSNSYTVHLTLLPRKPSNLDIKLKIHKKCSEFTRVF